MEHALPSSTLETSSSNKLRYWLWASNIVMGLLYFRFAYTSFKFLAATPQLSTIINFAFCTLAGIFLLIRRAPKSESRVLIEWFSAVGGTFAVLLFRPVAGYDHVVLTTVQIAGVCFSLTGLMSLGRSFGIVPANRGIQSHGLYRFIRHPMYAGYVVTFACFVAQNPSPSNLLLYMSFIAFKVLRITMEEAHLSQDPKYVEMKSRVRWRLIPFVW